MVHVQTGVSSSSLAASATGWMGSMLFLVTRPQLFFKMNLVFFRFLNAVHQFVCFFFFTLSGKVIDGLLIVRKIEVKLLIIFYRLGH